MRIVNRTTYPTKTVERLVKQTLADLDIDEGQRIGIIVETSKGDYMHGVYEYAYRRMVVYLPRRSIKKIHDYVPYRRQRDPGYRFPLADWREALVAVVAHEGEHHRQYAILGERPSRRIRAGVVDGKRRYWTSGTRRVSIESRCDLAAYRAWKRYRESRGLDTSEAVR